MWSISTVNSDGAGFVFDNSGAIDGAANLNGAGSQLFNSGEIAGGVSFGAGSEHFINNGTVIGNVTFDGTDNTYNGADGSATGEIIASGTAGTYIGGAGADTFVFTASGLGAGDKVQGGGGSNTLIFSTAGTIYATALGNVSGIETIDLANGTNSITLTNALVSSANGATLTVNGGTGADTINASAVSTATDNVIIDGGGGADTIDAGGAIDTFVYKGAGDSTGANYDTISGVNFGHDFFEVPGAPGTIKTINAAVTGSLSTATFNADLAAALTSSKLGAHDAVEFTATSGTLSGDAFLVVDLNGQAGYQANADLVVRLAGATGTLTTANFV